MLVDSHCHIHDRSTYDFALSRQQIGKKLLKEYPDLPCKAEDFAPEQIICRAVAKNVKKMLTISTSTSDSLEARSFASVNQGKGVFWSYGIHPDEAGKTSNLDTVLAEATSVIAESQNSTTAVAPVAIGEVGLDYRVGTSDKAAQIALLERMMQLAKDQGLPVIFHVRDAFEDFFAVTRNFPGIRGVVHSFSDSVENLQKSLDQGFFIGVNGLATFSDSIPTQAVPLERMLLETDAPFLTPVPFRGTINEPAHIPEICAFVAKIKGESEADVAQITTKNAEQLFKI